MRLVQLYRARCGCGVVEVSTVVLSTYIIVKWHGICDIMTTAGKNASWSIIIKNGKWLALKYVKFNKL